MILFFSSCQAPAGKGKAPSSPGSGKLKVVATFLPVYDLAVSVGGGTAEVTCLLPPGASPHTYESTPEDSRRLEEADVIFKLGLGLDDWIDRAVTGSGGKTLVAAVSKGVETTGAGKEEHQCCGGHDHGHENGGGEGVDPHVWMDPALMKVMAGNVRDIYIEKMPEKKGIIEGNYQEYVKKLDRLDGEYSRTLSAFKKKDFVTFHSFLTYTSRRYGMNQVAVIAEFPGKDPDPRHIIEVIGRLKKQGVKVVFAEPQFSPRASQAIAGEVGARVRIIDPVGSLGDPARNSYVKNMEENLKTLSEAFAHENEQQPGK
jgi:zinc transport system substrate-binding protein